MTAGNNAIFEATYDGLIWCLLASTAFVLSAGLLSFALPRPTRIPPAAVAVEAGD